MKTLITSLVLGMSLNAFAATQLDDLIRGEMSAVKSYDKVISKMKDPKEAQKLKVIREDHVNAVSKLKGYADKDVRDDTKTVGAWGTFAEVYSGGATLFGDKTALKALKQGEEHGIKEYQEALKDENIQSDLKTLIRTQLLPKQEAHLSTIKSFM